MSNTKEIHCKPRLHVSLPTCYLEYAPPPPQVFVRTDGRSLVCPYADVITKFSQFDELPFSFTHGALLAHFARQSSAKTKAIWFPEIMSSVLHGSLALLDALEIAVFQLDQNRHEWVQRVE